MKAMHKGFLGMVMGALGLLSASYIQARWALPSDSEFVSQRVMGSTASSPYQMETSWSPKRSPVEYSYPDSDDSENYVRRNSRRGNYNNSSSGPNYKKQYKNKYKKKYQEKYASKSAQTDDDPGVSVTVL